MAGADDRLGKPHQRGGNARTLEDQAGQDKQGNRNQRVFGHAVIRVGTKRAQHRGRQSRDDTHQPAQAQGNCDRHAQQQRQQETANHQQIRTHGSPLGLPGREGDQQGSGSGG